MASRPPPRFVVRLAGDNSQRKRWILLGVAWLASLLLTGLIISWLTGRTTPVAVDHHQQRALLAQLDDLKQQVANLQRSNQVNDVAARSLRGTLTQREEEIAGLRADLGFYSRLVSGGARAGIKIQEVKLQPISNTRGWNFTLSLAQNAKRSDEITGKVLVSVEGLTGNKVTQLKWDALGDASQKDGLPFHFMYFEQLHGTIVLPEKFRPTRLHISVQATGSAAVTRSVAWGDALRGNIITDQGDHDAQP
ncbi:MAG: DUF6776 family protein [Rhodanobacter sp.]